VSGPGHIIGFSNPAFDHAFPHASPGGVRSLGNAGRTGNPLGWDEVAKILDKVRSTGAPTVTQDLPVLFRSPSDATRLIPSYITVICSPVTDAAGAPTILFVAVDVTNRVCTNLDIELQHARLAASERLHRDISLTLQHSLLAPAHPTADTLDVAARYLAGTKGTEVGGDWYDVINLGAGRVAAVIGDVMGRGVHAAALMGQLRAAIRSYAHLDLPPTEVLRLLNSLIAELDSGTDGDLPKIATCLYGIYDPAGEEFSFSSAGHPPPVVVDPTGGKHVVRHDPDPPLGTGHAVAGEGRVPVPAGSVLALYTDGLVEQRGRDIDVGIAALRDALRTWDDLETVADQLLAELRPPGGYDDDAALLLVHVPPCLSAGQLKHSTLLVAGSYQSARYVRYHIRRVLNRWRIPADVVESAVPVADELITNALTHGEPPVHFTLRHMPYRIVIEVTDSNPQLPQIRHTGADAEHGRGLHIVAAVTSRWGSRVTTAGKVVWADVPFSMPPDYNESVRNGHSV
jgi:serine phosphatase RsbU (regulator of sigma subunit)